MSFLKWKELAKRKTELGNKINYVHDLITQHKIGYKPRVICEGIQTSDK